MERGGGGGDEVMMTSGATGRIVPVFRSVLSRRALMRLAVALRALFLWLLVLVGGLRRRGRAGSEAAGAGTWKARRRRQAAEDEDVRRRRALAEEVVMAEDAGQGTTRWDTFLVAGARRNALFCRLWAPAAEEMRHAGCLAAAWPPGQAGKLCKLLLGRLVPGQAALLPPGGRQQTARRRAGRSGRLAAAVASTYKFLDLISLSPARSTTLLHVLMYCFLRRCAGGARRRWRSVNSGLRIRWAVAEAPCTRQRRGPADGRGCLRHRCLRQPRRHRWLWLTTSSSTLPSHRSHPLRLSAPSYPSGCGFGLD